MTDSSELPIRTKMRSNITFDEVWERIESHAGKTFTTTRGLEFIYRAQLGTLVAIQGASRENPGKRNMSISKRSLEKAFALCPLPSTEEIRDMVSNNLIYSILSDPRVREYDW